MSHTPLKGVRVIEMGGWLTAPMTASILADQGADVIKVEPPAGDPQRLSGTKRGGHSAGFMAANRNKRSITLDVKKAEQKEVLRKLIARSDVLIHNLRPGAMERLDFPADRVRAENPRLIYASISGYGQTGPYSRDGAYDPIIQALSGIAALNSDKNGQPQLFRTLIADKTSPLIAAQAITSALFERERTGQGATLEYSMMDGMVWWMSPDVMIHETFIGDGVEGATSVADVSMIYESDDGFLVCTPHQDKDWPNFLRIVDRPDLGNNPLFATSRGRRTNLHEFTKAMGECFRGKTAAQWCELLREQDIPCAPVLSPAEVRDHPQVVWNGAIQEVEHPEAGAYRAVRSPTLFDGKANCVVRHAPSPGQHTAEILEELGISSA